MVLGWAALSSSADSLSRLPDLGHPVGVLGGPSLTQASQGAAGHFWGLMGVCDRKQGKGHCNRWTGHWEERPGLARSYLGHP